MSHIGGRRGHRNGQEIREACGLNGSCWQIAMIRNAGIEPTVIEYLKTPPTRERLMELIGKSGLSVRDVVRQKGTHYPL